MSASILQGSDNMEPLTMLAIASLIGAGVNVAGGLMENYNQRRKARESEQQASELSAEYKKLAQQAGSKAEGFGQTEYGKYLQKMSEQGMYTPAEEQRMLSRVSREAGGIEQEARQRYMGQLAARGLEGSVAGARGMNELTSRRMQIVSGAQQEISQSELEAKRRAEEIFAQTHTQYQQSYQDVRDQYMLSAIEARHGGAAAATAARAAGSEALVRGIGSGVQTAATTWAQGLQAKDLNDTLSGLLDQYKKAEGNTALQYQIGMQLREFEKGYYSSRKPGGTSIDVPRTW